MCFYFTACLCRFHPSGDWHLASSSGDVVTAAGRRERGRESRAIRTHTFNGPNNEGLNWKFGILDASLTHNRTRTLSSWCCECVRNHIKRSAPFTFHRPYARRQLCQFSLLFTRRIKPNKRRKENRENMIECVRALCARGVSRRATMWMNDGWFYYYYYAWLLDVVHWDAFHVPIQIAKMKEPVDLWTESHEMRLNSQHKNYFSSLKISSSPQTCGRQARVLMAKPTHFITLRHNERKLVWKRIRRTDWPDVNDGRSVRQFMRTTYGLCVGRTCASASPKSTFSPTGHDDFQR